MKKRVIQIIRGIVNNFIKKPLLVVKLLRNKDLYNANSYFPEKAERRKNQFNILIDQIKHVVRYGEINEFYFLYGFDIKNFRNQEDYVSYIDFMNRRNTKNKVGNVKSSVGVLRDKLFFSLIANGFNIKSINNLAYILDGKIVINDKMQKNLWDRRVFFQ